MMKKTTLVLDDYLFKEVKKFAIDNDRSFRDVAEAALRLYIKTPKNGTSVEPRSLRGIWKGKMPPMSEKQIKDFINKLWEPRDPDLL